MSELKTSQPSESSGSSEDLPMSTIALVCFLHYRKYIVIGLAIVVIIVGFLLWYYRNVRKQEPEDVVVDVQPKVQNQPVAEQQPKALPTKATSDNVEARVRTLEARCKEMERIIEYQQNKISSLPPQRKLVNESGHQPTRKQKVEEEIFDNNDEEVSEFVTEEDPRRVVKTTKRKPEQEKKQTFSFNALEQNSRKMAVSSSPDSGDNLTSEDMELVYQ